MLDSLVHGDELETHWAFENLEARGSPDYLRCHTDNLRRIKIQGDKMFKKEKTNQVCITCCKRLLDAERFSIRLQNTSVANYRAGQRTILTGSYCPSAKGGKLSNFGRLAPPWKPCVG